MIRNILQELKNHNLTLSIRRLRFSNHWKSLFQNKLFQKQPLLGKVLLSLCSFILLIFVVDHLFPPHLTKLQDRSAILLDENGELLTVHLAKDERVRLGAVLEEVDPLYIKMLIHFEDKRFYHHPGADPIALLRATAQSIRAGRIVSGGSSLTMQTVRLLEPRRRTFKNKVIEICRAIQLELHYSKKEILEMYLVLAPFGGNLEGIRAATLAYFGKEPKRLTLSEAALLVALPQSPNRLRPEIFAERCKKYRDKVIDRMSQKSLLTKQAAREAMEDRLPMKKLAFPRIAPHAAFMLTRQAPNQIQHKSFLNKQIQQQIEELLKQEMTFLGEGQSIAALVVENSSHQVKAYVGSSHFFDEKIKGQVNMIEAFRSPGSLLKPFIYAMAFEEGIAHPETLVEDVPTGFSGYHPSNFKDVFHGRLTMKEALQHSLNIPAVLLLERLGPRRFYSHLCSTGIQLKFENPEVDPSLPLALGGVGMRLWDLVSMYSALANEGKFEFIRLTDQKNQSNQKNRDNQKNEDHKKFKKEDHAKLKKEESTKLKKEDSTTLTDRESTILITQILEDISAPDGFIDKKWIGEAKLPYKTGTSYGHRDAWAIGYTEQYTVGIWVGKADGTTSTSITGRKTAAPILFKVFDQLGMPKNAMRIVKANQGTLTSMINREQLPKKLCEFKRKGSSNSRSIGNQEENTRVMKIQFPREGSILYLEEDRLQFHPITLTLSPGFPPYFCFVNGKLLDIVSQSSKIKWTPATRGFVELTILDSRGQSDTVNLELR